MIKIIGHRGAKGLAPENTLASIQKALELGVDEIEIDIRITSDGTPVLSHDRLLVTATSTYTISAMPYTELRTRYAELTTLAEVLKLIDGQACLYIEVKHGEPVQPVVDAVTKYEGPSATASWVSFGSKSQKTLVELHRLMPNIPKIVIEPWSSVRAHFRAKQVGTKRLSMRSWWLWRGLLKSMHKQGYLISPYTVNDPRKITKWEPYLYGVITDYPDRFMTQRHDA